MSPAIDEMDEIYVFKSIIAFTIKNTLVFIGVRLVFKKVIGNIYIALSVAIFEFSV